MELAPIRRWITCHTGFGQGEHRMTGVEKLQEALRVQCSCVETVVLLKSWRDFPASLAQRIANRCPDDYDPAIVSVGYSWGGYSAVLFARELQKRGLTVDHLLLCDAVWRSSFMFGYPLSLTDFFTITIPSNVKNLYTWRQTANVPRGSKIKLEDASKTIWHHDEVLPHLCHQHIDDYRPFRQKAMELACPRPAPPEKAASTTKPEAPGIVVLREDQTQVARNQDG